jgi:hypothetical protein
MTPVSEIPKLAGIYRLGAMISTSIADFGHDLPDTIPGADEKRAAGIPGGPLSSLWS